MTRSLVFAIGAICGMVIMAIPKFVTHLHAAVRHSRSSSEGSRVHTEETFEFIANRPIEQVAPLFGADKERVWAPGWNPHFVYPSPAADQPGMVFTTAHDHARSAVWVNTLFDLKNGQVQYAYVIPGVLVTLIDLKLTPQGDRTRVEVKYARTALGTDADAHVRNMAEGDRRAGPEWEQQVNGYLQNARH